jgi:hypothetical protein
MGQRVIGGREHRDFQRIGAPILPTFLFWCEPRLTRDASPASRLMSLCDIKLKFNRGALGGLQASRPTN